MQVLRVTKAWPAPQRVLKAGQDYSIPSEISRANARCCVVDGCGEIIEVEAIKEPLPFRKTGAPENKGGGRSPNSKPKVA